MYACMYVLMCMHACLYLLYTYACIHVCIYVCMHIYMYIYVILNHSKQNKKHTIYTVYTKVKSAHNLFLRSRCNWRVCVTVIQAVYMYFKYLHIYICVHLMNNFVDLFMLVLADFFSFFFSLLFLKVVCKPIYIADVTIYSYVMWNLCYIRIYYHIHH